MVTRKIVTRKDVAKKANVSEAVVSYVLNDSNYVSAEKRALVLDAIEKLGYEPNYFAKALKTKKSQHISVIASPLVNDFVYEIFTHMQKLAHDYHYTLSILNSQDFKTDLPAMGLSRSDGLIIISDRCRKEDLDNLAKKGIASMVFLTKRIQDLDSKMSSVYVDMELGIKQIFDFYDRQNHRKIIYLVHANETQPVESSGMYLSALAQAQKRGISLSLVEVNESDLSGINQSLDAALAADGQPKAVLAETDNLAMYFMGFAKTKGLVAPGDYVISGIGDSRISSYFDPALASIQYDKVELANILIKGLIDHMSTGKPNHHELGTKMVFRQSIQK